MKLHFEPSLDFQLKAIDSACDLFRGQEICRTEFTVTASPATPFVNLAPAEKEIGVGNSLSITDDQIFENLKEIQLRNCVPQSNSIGTKDFTVEMETGTGKTYVYLRTIFELNKRYGFTKFVIVVPSVAIKESVYKTLQITEEHFRSLYSGIPYEYFLYDSAKIGLVRNFVTSSQIQIMVVTVGSINKKNVNNLYKENEKTGGERPIDLIRAVRPVLIVDEPQSVDGGIQGRGREALEKMNSLCSLRYSATHADQFHMLFRLDAVDAYERKLVKQVEVASAMVEDAFNKPFIRLLSTNNRAGQIYARVELDVEYSGRVLRRVKPVMDGDDLEQISGRRVYGNFSIGEIRTGPVQQQIELRVPNNSHYLQPGESYGDVDPISLAKEMIRRTIREHLDKEIPLRRQGIKVLSLFFVDSVALYRQYDEDGNIVKGEYAKIFESEYLHFANNPNYRDLFSELGPSTPIEEIHNGYFSIDKTGSWTNTIEDNERNRTCAERAYNLIMRDKEKLLSLGNPLRFIFSHSALREGWDNPNVFQICALRNIQTNRERRQTIGRGMRLCVNQDGQRQRGFDVNKLTVIASESYEEFARNLQKEIEQDSGLRFGVIEFHQFANVSVVSEHGDATCLGFDVSKEVWLHLNKQGYIDAEGRIQQSLRNVLQDETLVLPDYVERNASVEINKLLRKIAGPLPIKNADERRLVRSRQAVLDSQEFKELWNRIKYKTSYRLAFDNDILLQKCTQALREAPPIPKTRIQWRKGEIAIEQAGVTTKNSDGSATVVLREDDIYLPDVITELQDKTKLTRRSIYIILTASQRLEDYKQNPQKFIELAEQTINRCKRFMLVDGIKYQRLGDDHYFAQELFETQELTGYLRNMLDSDKSVFEKVVYESAVEAHFADQLEKNLDVKLFTKLPGWFTVPTPLGSYNPDWAVLIETQEGGESLYLVVETKSSLHTTDLRLSELSKIKCAKEHFCALKVGSSPAEFTLADSVDNLLATIENSNV